MKRYEMCKFFYPIYNIDVKIYRSQPANTSV